MKLSVAGRCFLAAGLFFGAGRGFASEIKEPCEFYLEPMTVTADRYDGSEISPGHYIVTEEKLEQGNYENALDVLQELPGITVAARGAGGGFNGYSNILLNGSDRYVVVVDGFMSNWNGSAHNVFDFSVLPAEMLQSVEVLPPSSGMIYGSAAKGGVIKITTKKAAENKTDMVLSRGSYGHEGESIVHRGQNRDWSWFVAGSKSITGDYSSARHRIESYENTENIGAKITRAWGDAASITFKYSSFSGLYKSKVFNYKGTEKRIFLVDGDKEESGFSLEYERKISDAESNVFGLYRRGSNAEYDRNNQGRPPWLLDLRTQGFFDRYSKKWHDKNILTGGVEYYQEKVLKYQDLLSSHADRMIVNRAAYLQNRWNWDDKTAVTGILRFDDNSYAGSRLSPGVTMEYRPSEKWLYSLGYTEYFLPPKQLELFASHGNDSLRPEAGRVYEAGAAYTPDSSLLVKASVFHRDAEDVIGYRRFSSVDIRYDNITREKASGFTLSLTKRLSDLWKAAVAYSQTEVRSEKAEDTAVLGAKMPHGELLFDLVYDDDKCCCMLEGRGVFDQANGRGEGRFANNTYWVWDASLNYRPQKNTKLYFKVNNLFDKFYSGWDNDTKGFLSFDEWYAEPGRNYQMGVNYSF